MLAWIVQIKNSILTTSKINKILNSKGIHCNLKNSSKEALEMKLEILSILIREAISQVTNWKITFRGESEEIQNEARRRKEKIRPTMNLIQNTKQRILRKLSLIPLWKD